MWPFSPVEVFDQGCQSSLVDTGQSAQQQLVLGYLLAVFLQGWWGKGRGERERERENVRKILKTILRTV